MDIKRRFCTFCSETFTLLQLTSPPFILPLEPSNFVYHVSLNHPTRVAAPLSSSNYSWHFRNEGKKRQIGMKLLGKKSGSTERRFPQDRKFANSDFFGPVKKNKNFTFFFLQIPLT